MHHLFAFVLLLLPAISTISAQGNHTLTPPSAFGGYGHTLELADGTFVQTRNRTDPGGWPDFELLFRDANDRVTVRPLFGAEDERPSPTGRYRLDLLPFTDSSALITAEELECDVFSVEFIESGPGSDRVLTPAPMPAVLRSVFSGRLAANPLNGTIAVSDGVYTDLFDSTLQLRYREPRGSRVDNLSVKWLRLTSDSSFYQGICSPSGESAILSLALDNNLAAFGYGIQSITQIEDARAEYVAQDARTRSVYFWSYGAIVQARPGFDSVGRFPIEVEGEVNRLGLYDGLLGVWATGPDGTHTLTRVDTMSGAIVDVTRLPAVHRQATIETVWWTRDTVYLAGNAATVVTDARGVNAAAARSALQYSIAAGATYVPPLLDLRLDELTTEPITRFRPDCSGFDVTHERITFRLTNTGADTIFSCELIALPLSGVCPNGCVPPGWGVRRRISLRLAPGRDTLIELAQLGFSGRRGDYALGLMAIHPNDQLDVNSSDNVARTQTLVATRPSPPRLVLDYWQDRGRQRLGLHNAAGRPLELRLLDASGRLVLRQMAAGDWSASTAALVPGLYLLHVRDRRSGAVGVVKVVL